MSHSLVRTETHEVNGSTDRDVSESSGKFVALSEISDLPVFQRAPRLRLNRPHGISGQVWDVMTDDQKELILFRHIWGMRGSEGEIEFGILGTKFMLERPIEFSEEHFSISVAPANKSP